MHERVGLQRTGQVGNERLVGLPLGLGCQDEPGPAIGLVGGQQRGGCDEALHTQGRWIGAP